MVDMKLIRDARTRGNRRRAGIWATLSTIVGLFTGVASADTISLNSQYEYSLEDRLRRRNTTLNIADNENDESLLGDIGLTIRDTQGDELPAALLTYDWNNWGVWAYGERPHEGEAVADGGAWLTIVPPKTKDADPRLTAVVEAGFNGGAEPIYRSGALRARGVDLGFMDFNGDAAFFQNYGEEIDAQDHGYGWAAFSDDFGFMSIGRNLENKFVNSYIDLGVLAAQGYLKFGHDNGDSYSKFILAVDPSENYFSASCFNSQNGEKIVEDTFLPTYKTFNWKGAGQATYIRSVVGDIETRQLEVGARLGESLALGLGVIEKDGDYDFTGSLAVKHKVGRATVAGEAKWNGAYEVLDAQFGIVLPY